MSQASDGSFEADPGAGRRWLRNPYLWAAIAGLILIPAIRPLTRRVPAPPPPLGAVPRFSLIDQHGNAFDSDRLRDRVWLASFVDASSEDPGDQARMDALVGLQRRCDRMGVKLWLVSFSKRPESDTPAALRSLLERHGGSPEHWVLLTGRPAEAHALLAGGFGPYVEKARAAQAALPPRALAAPHPRERTDSSLLVDGDGQVRGAYPTDEDGLYEVFHRAQHVMSLKRAWR